MNETITVVIGDTNAEYAQAIRHGLEAHGYTVLKVAEDGITLIDAIKRLRPGLVIMDVILSRLDGFAVMEELHQLPSLEWPKILVHTALNQENIMLRIYSMGADYLSKPAPISQVVRRVDAMFAGNYRQGVESAIYQSMQNDELRQKVSVCLKRLGISPRLRGYRYLVEGILLVMRDISILDRCTSVLYPYLGKIFHSTPERVERCMRYSIETAFERGNLSDIEQVFGYTVDVSKGKPTNSQFMAMVADHLLLN